MHESNPVDSEVPACMAAAALALVRFHISRAVAALHALHANRSAPVLDVVVQDMAIELVRLFLAAAGVALHQLLLPVARTAHGGFSCNKHC